MKAKIQFFTIGYEKKSPEDFLKILQENGIRQVIDIRELPISRKRGFSKNRLCEFLKTQEIDYLHIKAAGNPHRHLAGSIEYILEQYEDHLQQSPEILKTVRSKLDVKKSALLCVEADPDCCHRSVLAGKLSKQYRELEFINL